jgi:phosphatidylserine/phosphatidylglycerophosphate/cardiolipin synthase-like enzyme
VGNALAVVTRLIQGAQHTLQIEMEEIHENYPAIEQQLVNAAAQQVTVQVILPDKPTQGKMTTQTDIGFLTKSGVQVQYSSPSTPIMHAKMILVDALLENGQVVSGTAFVGSQNLTTAAIENNREVGLVISDPQVLNQLWQTFQQDWSNSQSTPSQW